ncbi:MAG: nucleotide exchange factor GrpE, partial [Muribaculaceae bacterium]|nr:nucleotide exchange factor GrpE [Muribaculaceae bacterium]
VEEEVVEEAPADEVAEENSLEKEVEDLRAQLEKEKKEYLFLMADFDNFRKRTLKEKSELIKNAGENVLKGLLPIMDDCERGIQASAKDEAAASAVEGMQLIYNKLVKFLEANGVKEMETTGQPFDSDLHEAIAQVPAQSEEQKGKVIDTVQKGYMINDKVLRHAKVAVAQ